MVRVSSAALESHRIRGFSYVAIFRTWQVRRGLHFATVMKSNHASLGAVRDHSGRKPGGLWRSLVAGATLSLLMGCASPPPAKQYSFSPDVMQAVMKRKNKVVRLSGEKDRGKPVLLLLHGATDDPTEMLDIGQEWTGEYD